jgi:hypothetical protein
MIFVFIYSLYIFGLSSSFPILGHNLCVNCKFYIKPRFNDLEMDYGRCKNFRITKNGNRAPIDTDYAFCSTSRMFKEMCGREGKLFEKLPSIQNGDSCKSGFS